METKDNEYFRSAVTDEWNTLRPLTEQEQTEGKKQKSVRARQHKTARRAFSLAAPVAVVAVTATLVTTLSSLSCPVCGKTKCNYFFDATSFQTPAQILYEEDVPIVQPESSDAADRLTYFDYAFKGVGAQDEHNYLEMDGLTAGISGRSLSNLLRENHIEYSSVSGSSVEDQESGARLVYKVNLKDGIPVLYAELVYLPQGGSPQEKEAYGENNLEILFARQQDYTYAIMACEQPNLWLRAYSTVPGIPAEQVLEAMGKPLILPLPGSKVNVGNTLYMSLPASQYLWSSEIQKTYFGYEYFYGEDGKTISELPTYTLSQGPKITEYNFTGKDSSAMHFYIKFAARDWNKVADAWNKLYRQAPGTGHKEWGMLVPMESMTVNGVTYDVYLDFIRKTVEGEYRCRAAWFIPRQQPTCLISCYVQCPITTEPFSFSGRRLEEVASSGEKYEEILALFYPVGTEPNPIQTQTPIPTQEPAPTATPDGEETVDGISEFSYDLPDMHLADAGPYTQEEADQANRVTSLISPGSGRTLVAVRKAFETQTDTSNGNAVVTTADAPYSNTELYSWIDSDGTLNWYRDTNGLGIDAYAIVRPEGLSCRYEWTAEGPVSYTVYPDRNTVFDRYDQNPFFAYSQLDGGLFEYSAANSTQVCAKYTLGASFEAPVSLQNGGTFMTFGDTTNYDLSTLSRMYTFYLDENMRLLSALYTYGLGTSVVTPDYTVFGVVEGTPDITPAMEAFDRLETVDCGLNVNGYETNLPLYTGIRNHIAVYAESTEITVDTPVEQQDGTSNVIPDGGAFIPGNKPVNISVRYSG